MTNYFIPNDLRLRVYRTCNVIIKFKTPRLPTQSSSPIKQYVIKVISRIVVGRKRFNCIGPKLTNFIHNRLLQNCCLNNVILRTLNTRGTGE